ncbi:hypothetical protein PCANC_03937 [Puccinia coronata f. sp. avenae]|uniref:Uncharacterized protein n=1 Tax=Puccinia coronata f. sp. avenae TaxID=200324 RepID=A0A2N5W1H1_9BASI|nr:hypothetical protein PCANC_03937 [Puccinia coronata f. sp. avenae]
MSQQSSSEIQTQMSLPNSPNPHNSPSPHPHNSPQPLIAFSVSLQPRNSRISPLPPSPSLPPVSPIPNFSPCPIDARHTYGQTADEGLIGKNSVLNLLSELSIDNQPIQEAVMSNTQRIAQLQTTNRRQQKDIVELKGLLLLSADVVKLKADLQQDLLQICQGIDAVNTSTHSRLETLRRGAARPSEDPVVKWKKPPYYAHLAFSGDVKETNSFCFFIRNSFEQLTDHFASDKHCILWIAGYFCLPEGKLGDGVFSYNWWRGFLGKNAAAQGLDASKGSLAAPFVVKELLSAKFFLQSIERTFSNHKEMEDSLKALKALKQGKETIEQLNIIFNSLLYLVDLSDASECEIYTDAIHPENVNLGLQRGAKVLVLEQLRAKGITAKVEQQVLNLSNNRVIAPVP